MNAISLTTFIDFISKSGTPKMTIVREYKNSGAYDPTKDYWKRLRDAIVRMHTNNGTLGDLAAIAASATEKKSENYATLVNAYKEWVGKQTLLWFRPTKADWRSNGMAVQVNPELGLEIGGIRHLIKLYFKEDKLPANRAALVLHMMHVAAGPHSNNSTVMGLLDIRKGKLHTSTGPVKAHDVQLAGEAAYWAAVYPDA